MLMPKLDLLWVIYTLAIAAFDSGFTTTAQAGQPAPVIFCCPETNDLYRAVKEGGTPILRFDHVAECLSAASEGGAVLVLNGETPLVQGSDRSKHIKIYRELPTHPPLSTKQIETERVIVSGRIFGDDLPIGRILSIGHQPIALVKVDHPILSVGRVAGFDHLVFGMPATVDPLLWETAGGDLVAAAPLSQFVSGRYGPNRAWVIVWQAIFRQLGVSLGARGLATHSSLDPAFSAQSPLPKNAEEHAIEQAALWYSTSGLLLSKEALAFYSQADQWPDRVGPRPTTTGDGTEGILEGFASHVDTTGNQPVRWYRRADCQAESAMALALSGLPQAIAIGRKIADFVTAHSIMSTGPRADPSNPSFGLVGWNDTGVTGPRTFYGDDNARYVLGLIGTAGGAS